MASGQKCQKIVTRAQTLAHLLKGFINYLQKFQITTNFSKEKKRGENPHFLSKKQQKKVSFFFSFFALQMEKDSFQKCVEFFQLPCAKRASFWLLPFFWRISSLSSPFSIHFKFYSMKSCEKQEWILLCRELCEVLKVQTNYSPPLK
jgi:hypothetical protein